MGSASVATKRRAHPQDGGPKISHTKIWGRDKKDVIYHNVDTFTRDVAMQIGATLEQLQACVGDLRHLQQHVLMGKHWMDGNIDKGGHTFFDTMAILNGKDREPCHHNEKLLKQTVLASADALDACSQFYDTLSFQDQNRWIPGGHS